MSEPRTEAGKRLAAWFDEHAESGALSWWDSKIAAIEAEADKFEFKVDGEAYEVKTWVRHEPSGIVVLKGHPQLGGRYCTTDGGDWPCAAVRYALGTSDE